MAGMVQVSLKVQGEHGAGAELMWVKILAVRRQQKSSQSRQKGLEAER